MRWFWLVLAIALSALPSVSRADPEYDSIMLHGAAREGDVARIKAMLDRGVDVNIRNSGGSSPLMSAANEGRTEAVKLLLARGADPAIKNSSGWDAAFLAKLNKHEETLAVLHAASGASKPPQAAAAVPATRPSQVAAAARPSVPLARPGAGGPSAWPKLGAFQPGQPVLYSGTAGKTWRPGVVKRVNPPYGYDLEDVTGSEDAYFVTTRERQPYWTGWFVGDWRISVPMAMGTVTDGRNIYRTVSGGLRLPPLRINVDGTYTWRVQAGGGERLLRGRWEPNPEGPGVILRGGEHGADWLVYNNSRTGSTLGETVILSAEGHPHHDGSRLGR